MRRLGVACVVVLIVLGSLGNLLVQVSPGVVRRAHQLLVRRTIEIQAATADALQPDILVLDLHRHHPHKKGVARRHAARRPHRILLMPIYAWHPDSVSIKALGRRVAPRPARKRQGAFATSLAMMEGCGFAPWVIDFYRRAGRECDMLPHEVVKLVATRAAARLIKTRVLDDEPRRDSRLG